MTENIGRFLTIPVAVPVWGVIAIMAGVIYTAGATMQKLDYVIASTSKIETVQQQVLSMQILDNTQSQEIKQNSRRLDRLESPAGALSAANK